MKKHIVALSLIALFLAGCNAGNTKQNDSKSAESKAMAKPEESVADLANIIQQMEQATVDQHYSLLLELNRSFHFTIYKAANLPLLLEMIDTLWNRSALYRRVFTYLPERAVQALEEHKQIYEACRLGKEKAAEDSVRLNIRLTVEALSVEFLKADTLAVQPLAQEL